MVCTRLSDIVNPYPNVGSFLFFTKELGTTVPDNRQEIESKSLEPK
jgi:hypothetical protein